LINQVVIDVIDIVDVCFKINSVEIIFNIKAFVNF